VKIGEFSPLSDIEEEEWTIIEWLRLLPLPVLCRCSDDGPLSPASPLSCSLMRDNKRDDNDDDDGGNE